MTFPDRKYASVADFADAYFDRLGAAAKSVDRGRLAAVDLHVAGDNYGVIEDVHQSLMHILAQFPRQARMSEDLVKQRKF